jgi:prephenate dehydrogenase
VIGTGLIGLSIALAWRAQGGEVTIEDIDQARANSIADRYGWPVRSDQGTTPAGAPSSPPAFLDAPELVVVAVPPAHSQTVLLRAARLYINTTVIDVAGIKLHVEAEVETSVPRLSNIVLTHPLAGTATQGPAGADPSLFTDRVWLVTPSTGAEPARIEGVERFVRLLGGVPIRISAARHDAALATTSHLPQLTASALASLLPSLGDDVGQLAGPGLVDMTRLAASPTPLWVDITLANRAPIGLALDRLIATLTRVRGALHLADEASAAATVAAVLDAGRDGRSLLAVKHPGLRGMDSASRPASRPDTGAGAGDEPRQAYVWVEVHLQDRPGQLAAVLAAAAEADVNVEDVRLEHATHAAAGTLSLAVASAEAPRLQALLDARALGHRGE